ncbi:MAG: SDR family oxidoreductase [Burkholderiaceae bacterium]
MNSEADSSSGGGTDQRAGSVLVTGAARRIGRTIALAMARAGWNVAVHYRRSADEAHETVDSIRALGRRAVAVRGDLGSPADVDRLFDEAAAALPLTAVVNNASLFAYDAPASFTTETLLAHAGPNLAAPMQLARRLYERLGAPEAEPHPPGVVINLLDQKLENLNPDFFSYTVTKFGLLGATRMMAMAFAPRLRVLGVSPGITMVSGSQTEAGFQRAHAMTPMGRSSDPADIADAVVYLAGAHAITGVNLCVDGGQHLLASERDVMFLTPTDSC